MGDLFNFECRAALVEAPVPKWANLQNLPSTSTSRATDTISHLQLGQQSR
jgi:hypothetical protein